MPLIKIPQVITEPLGGGPLTRDRAGAAAAFFPAVPHTAAQWRARAEATRLEFERRDWLGPLEPAFGASGTAAARLQRVSDQRGVVVTTGQQPGLFGGPLYTLYKALTALALADAIEAATGVPAAPVFWAATDDTDFEEAREAAASLPGGVQRVLLPESPAYDGFAMADYPLNDVRDLMEPLLRGTGSGSNDAAVQALRAAYHTGATLGSAYIGLLRTLLQPLGISVLDASDEATRQGAGATLRRALSGADRVAPALAARTAAIVAAGYTPQVHDVGNLSLVWQWTNGVRRRLTVAEAASAARKAPEGSLSANVLLRPIVERQLLPTVAYVGGPGEIAYFAQVGAVAQALELAEPIVVPRWSGSVVEPHIQRLLERLGLERSAVQAPHAAETLVARRVVPVDVRTSLDGLREDINARLQRARESGAHLLPDKALDGAQRQLLHRLEKLEGRYVTAVKREQVQLMRDVATLRGALYPDGFRQERVLSFVPMLGRHGETFFGALRAAAAEHANALVDSAIGSAGLARV